MSDILRGEAGAEKQNEQIYRCESLFDEEKSIKGHEKYRYGAQTYYAPLLSVNCHTMHTAFGGTVEQNFLSWTCVCSISNDFLLVCFLFVAGVLCYPSVRDVATNVEETDNGLEFELRSILNHLDNEHKERSIESG